MKLKKIAIVHEWFVTIGGSEKVTGELLQIFPYADLFSLIDFLPKMDREFLNDAVIQTSFLQRAPLIKKFYRNYLPLMPFAIEQINLSNYDLVISNCHTVTKGILTGSGQLHISYIHTPIRYAWDMQNEYLQTSGFSQLVARIFLHYIRNWDMIASTRPDKVVASSNYIARRIQKIYRRESKVIYPPVDTNYFTLQTEKEDFYLTASRLVPYKRIDLIVHAFQKMPDKKLVIIGDGPDSVILKRLDAPNIKWLGYQPKHVLKDYMQRCRAFVFAAREDFGITPVEAQACGTPVIAFAEGGSKETVNVRGTVEPTGILFESQSVNSLQAAIIEFEYTAEQYTPEACRNNAEKYSNQRFRKEFSDFVFSEWDIFQQGTNGVIL